MKKKASMTHKSFSKDSVFHPNRQNVVNVNVEKLNPIPSQSVRYVTTNHKPIPSLLYPSFLADIPLFLWFVVSR